MERTVELGQVVITATANEILETIDVLKAVRRHQTGDWGDLSVEDALANERALLEGSRVLSAYKDRHNTVFWIITEADRSSSTILLPTDY